MKRRFSFSKTQFRFLVVLSLGMVAVLVTMGSGWLKTSGFQTKTSVREIVPEPVVETVESKPSPEPASVVHIPLPDEVRGIYWNTQTAGSDRGDVLLAYMKERGLNTVVMDLKTDDGQLAFTPNDPALVVYAQKNPSIASLDDRLKQLQADGIYRVARIAVMRDGMFATVHPNTALKTKTGVYWKDKVGSLWLDPTAPEVASYAIALAKEAYTRGFDEVQFDYVRFASDGHLPSIRYPFYKETQPKAEVMKTFFQTVGGAMKDANIPVSFDVFGMTCWTNGDVQIGQRLQDVFPVASFVSPMVYPSHFPNGFEGYKNPALFPYEIIKKSLDKGAEQILAGQTQTEADVRKKFRPWLQDFDIGAVYTADKIEAQIKAARDAKASGWVLWNTRNVYEPAQYVPKEKLDQAIE